MSKFPEISEKCRILYSESIVVPLFCAVASALLLAEILYPGTRVRLYVHRHSTVPGTNEVQVTGPPDLRALIIM